MTCLTYQGYFGSIETSVEDECLFGKIQFIDDVVLYEGQTVPEIKKAFEDAVDRYLAHCAKTAKEPCRPFSGSFNVRIDKEAHRKAAQSAFEKGVTLNEFVAEAIATHVEGRKAKVENHIHIHPTKIVDSTLSSRELRWEETNEKVYKTH